MDIEGRRRWTGAGVGVPDDAARIHRRAGAAARAWPAAAHGEGARGGTRSPFGSRPGRLRIVPVARDHR
ncbi:hypothetical protein GCM10010326_11340 [Streptomyces xanthochromogenes]|uniref:Uncharacterized protein n=1 Tax=Streptomyces xanthochromogenes TaxID=67384 RepID=A0ABQ2ZNE5_9ACTN|nr:hypothetical protein GCM10010326_11340 [Streptomyces xanthochromogenes]